MLIKKTKMNIIKFILKVDELIYKFGEKTL